MTRTMAQTVRLRINNGSFEASAVWTFGRKSVGMEASDITEEEDVRVQKTQYNKGSGCQGLVVRFDEIGHGAGGSIRIIGAGTYVI